MNGFHVLEWLWANDPLMAGNLLESKRRCEERDAERRRRGPSTGGASR